MLINQTGTRGRSRIDDGLRILEARGIQAEPLLLRTPERIPDIIRERAAECELVILGGGDGTFSHALDALLSTGRPLGILPMGNANDLARTLGIPTDSAAACQVIAEGKRRADRSRLGEWHALLQRRQHGAQRAHRAPPDPRQEANAGACSPTSAAPGRRCTSSDRSGRR